MRHRRQRLDIADVARGIADALAKDGNRVVVDQRLDIGGVVRCGLQRLILLNLW